MLVTLAFTALYDAASQFETPFGNDISDFHLNMFEKSLVLDIYSMLEVSDGTVTGEYAGSAYRRRRESQSIELLQMITDGDTRMSLNRTYQSQEGMENSTGPIGVGNPLF